MKHTNQLVAVPLVAPLSPLHADDEREPSGKINVVLTGDSGIDANGISGLPPTSAH
jgi:hypothetical protein